MTPTPGMQSIINCAKQFLPDYAITIVVTYKPMVTLQIISNHTENEERTEIAVACSTYAYGGSVARTLKGMPLTFPDNPDLPCGLQTVKVSTAKRWVSAHIRDKMPKKSKIPDIGI